MDNSGYIQSSYNPHQEDIIKYLESLGAKVSFKVVSNLKCVINTKGFSDSHLAFSCEFYNGIFYYMSSFCSNLKEHLSDYLENGKLSYGDYSSHLICKEWAFTKDLCLKCVS